MHLLEGGAPSPPAWGALTRCPEQSLERRRDDDQRLVGYGWHGNVRELANVLERAVALADHDTVLVEDLDFPQAERAGDRLWPGHDGQHMSLEDLERSYARHIVQAQNGNKAAAARILRIDRRTLYRLLEG